MSNPIDILPIDPPATYDPGEDNPSYFYNNIIKPMIPDFIRMGSNYLTLDWEKVEELRLEIDDVLENVSKVLDKNQIIIDFQMNQYPIRFKEYETEVSKSMRTVEFYIKEYKETNTIHRLYLVNSILAHIGLESMQKDKWTVKDIKHLYDYSGDPMIAKVINKQFNIDDPIVLEAMIKLATDKMTIWNRPRHRRSDSLNINKIQFDNTDPLHQELYKKFEQEGKL